MGAAVERVLQLNDTTRLVGILRERPDGSMFVDLRKFIASDRYIGPSRSGIWLAIPSVKAVHQILRALCQAAALPGECELAQFNITPRKDLVVRITQYGGGWGVDIREWLNGTKYTGWSRHGIRIATDKLPEALRLFEDLLYDGFQARAMSAGVAA